MFWNADKASDTRLARSRSVSGSLSHGWADANSEIFYIYNERWTGGMEDLSNEKVADDKMKPATLMHHSNLEVGHLTVRQQTRLACIYYANWRHLLRGVIILGAIAWFGFNAFMVIEDFLSSQTVVYLEYQKPDVTMPPAVSICVVCRSCL